MKVDSPFPFLAAATVGVLVGGCQGGSFRTAINRFQVRGCRTFFNGFVLPSVSVESPDFHRFLSNRVDGNEISLGLLDFARIDLKRSGAVFQ